VLTIRLAEAANQAGIVRLWHQGWHDAHAALVPPEVLAFRTIDHFHTWLGEARDTFHVAIDTELRGFVTVKDAEIVKLYVGRNARGQGIAQKLLSFAERKLSENGVREAELFCTAGNSRAENFYLREGWTLSRTFEDYLWMPEGSTIGPTMLTHRFQKNLLATA
jgi:GNAT superfamily N-acetyltransferase